MVQHKTSQYLTSSQVSTRSTPHELSKPLTKNLNLMFDGNANADNDANTGVTAIALLVLPTGDLKKDGKVGSQ